MGATYQSAVTGNTGPEDGSDFAFKTLPRHGVPPFLKAFTNARIRGRELS